MTKICAVICELNPAHAGHKYIFDRARSSGACVVAVMSGNFVQRANAAVFDKYARAAAAVMCGADLVLELVFPYSAASAQYFARAGVSVAKSIGADMLYFGSECADKELLERTSEIIASGEFAAAVAGYEKADRTAGHAAVRERVMRDIAGEHASKLLRCPNDILATEYISAARQLGFEGELVPVERVTGVYDGRTVAAASLLRQRIYENGIESVRPYMTKEMFELLKDARIVQEGRLSRLEYESLRLSSAAPVSFAECGQGVGERLYKTAGISLADSFFEKCATKKYTRARLARAALFALCGVTKEDISARPEYSAALAMNSAGREALSRIKKSFAVVTKPADYASVLTKQQAASFERAAFADNVYALCADREAGYFMKKSPCVFTETQN